jgi:hypothetical protein
MDEGRRNSLKAGLGALTLGMVSPPREACAAATARPRPDGLANAWHRRCRLIRALAPSRHGAIRRANAAADAEREFLATGEARICAIEAQIVAGHARSLAGLAAQACLLSEYCELGTRTDDGDLVLARKIASALVLLANQDAGETFPEA